MFDTGAIPDFGRRTFLCGIFATAAGAVAVGEGAKAEQMPKLHAIPRVYHF